MKKIVILSILTSSLLVASGYRLPESSLKSNALAAAYVANANGADSAYYNPANMVFNEDANFAEFALTSINLSNTKYTDSRNPAFNSESKKESLLAPTMFFSSKDMNGFRYGFAFVVPGGLTKRWDDPYAKTFAQEFALKIIELNPVVAYKINSQFALGGGLRLIYSEGVVKSDGSGIGKPIVREMEANTIEFGYNLALTYKPIDEVNLAATYRSNVDINEEGNAKLYLSGTKLYDGGGSVEVPLPAVAALAISYDFGKTVLELEYDRTFWSQYESLDFEFKDTVPAALQDAFDKPKPRDWEDTDAFRLGLTHQLNEKITLLGGFAIDENPVPAKNISFELPDSDALLYSGGINYQYNDDFSFGASLLYTDKEDKSVKNSDGTIDGSFKNSSATLVNIGGAYKF